MSEAPPSLGARAATGMAWLASQTVAARGITILAQWILANFILGPKQFGQIGLVYTITVLATQLTNPGVDDVLLQRQSHIRRWVTPAFWISMICALFGAVIMALAGGVVVLIAQARGNLAYGNPDIFYMTLILALGAPLNAAALVPGVMLRSELRFAKLSLIYLGEVIIQQMLILVLAALGLGAYSFVIPMPLVAGLRLIVLWWLVRPPVRLTLALHRWPALIGATGWVFGQRMLTTLMLQGDYIVLGALIADEAVIGVYFYAFTLSMQVMRVLCDNVLTVTMPILNRIQHDPPRMGLAAARSAKVLSAICVPLITLQILLAGPTVRLFFVEKWLSMIPLIQLLGIGQLVAAPGWPMTAMITASGRFRSGFFVWLINILSFFALIIPLTWFWSSHGTALGVGLWLWFATAVIAIGAYRSMHGLAVFLGIISHQLLAAAIASIPVIVALLYVPKNVANDILMLAIGTPLILVGYFIMLRAIDREGAGLLVDSVGGMARPLARRFFPVHFTG